MLLDLRLSMTGVCCCAALKFLSTCSPVTRAPRLTALNDRCVLLCCTQVPLHLFSCDARSLDLRLSMTGVCCCAALKFLSTCSPVTRAPRLTALNDRCVLMCCTQVPLHLFSCDGALLDLRLSMTGVCLLCCTQVPLHLFSCDTRSSTYGSQ